MFFPNSFWVAVEYEIRAAQFSNIHRRTAITKELSYSSTMCIAVRPYSTLRLKSRLFHNFAHFQLVFFRSRIYAAHARVIRDAVNREHVRGGSGID